MPAVSAGRLMHCLYNMQVMQHAHKISPLQKATCRSACMRYGCHVGVINSHLHSMYRKGHHNSSAVLILYWVTMQARVARLRMVSGPHQQLWGDNAQSAQQGPTRMDDLNLTVAGKSLRVSRQAGSVPAIVPCIEKDYYDSLLCELVVRLHQGKECMCDTLRHSSCNPRWCNGG